MSFVEVPNGIVYTQCPHGRDDKAIRPGETLYGNDGKAWKIRAVGPTYCYADEGGMSYRLRAEWLTHERPDSWERLTEELRDAGESGGGIVCAYYGHADDESCVGCPAFEGLMECEERFARDLINRINRLREAGHD